MTFTTDPPSLTSQIRTWRACDKRSTCSVNCTSWFPCCPPNYGCSTLTLKRASVFSGWLTRCDRSTAGLGWSGVAFWQSAGVTEIWGRWRRERMVASVLISARIVTLEIFRAAKLGHFLRTFSRSWKKAYTFSYEYLFFRSYCSKTHSLWRDSYRLIHPVEYFFWRAFSYLHKAHLFSWWNWLFWKFLEGF